jgi:hypothetical protein
MKRCLILSAWLCAAVSRAAVHPAGIFTGHAVLQQGAPVRIWGTASPGEGVSVSFAGQTKKTVADKTGDWRIALDPLPVSAESRTLVFQGSETPQSVVLNDIVVGEVWLAGGQSNMAKTMESFKKTTQADMDHADDSLLRMATIPIEGYEGANNQRPQWQTTTPQTVKEFSATAYYFAKNIRLALGVPVGIVTCAAGGTPAEAWMSRETLSSDPLMKRVLDNYEKIYRRKFPTDADYLSYCENYPEQMKVFMRKNASGEKPNPRPVWEHGPRHFQRPCGLYEVMLKQTIPYTIRGVVWYQGENNANSLCSWHYRQVFSALIKEWRQNFRNPKLPFLYVQLPTFGSEQDPDTAWPELRESQRLVEDDVPDTGMAVLVDGGEQNDIHPHSKDKAGLRLALLARNLVYGEKALVCRGPRLAGKTCRGGVIELTFTDTGSGLVLKPETVSAFEVCGSDGKFVPAHAELADGKIIVSSTDVPSPEDVRYGWKKWFVPSLYNKEGLPASPFRTDSQPMKTEGAVNFDTKL